jgi:hypothetical protein
MSSSPYHIAQSMICKATIKEFVKQSQTMGIENDLKGKK